MKKNSKMRKSIKDKLGFSLIELVVVVSIMAVLSGMLIPMFVKYLNTKKETACRANREGLLNVYSKGIYDNSMILDATNLQLVIEADASSGVLAEDYAGEAKFYVECPMGGIYTPEVAGSVAKITCSEHGEDIVIMDFTGWEGFGKEAMADPGYGEPSPSTPPVATEPPEPTVEPSVTPTPGKETGVWPYQYNDDGTLDPRWADAHGGAGKGCIPGNCVDIPVPQKAHFINNRNNAEYVIVKPRPCMNDSSKQNVYCVAAEWADGPDTIDEAGWDILVKVYRKFDTIDNPPPHQTTVQWNGTVKEEENFYEVTYGDIVTIHFPSGNVATYIYANIQYAMQNGPHWIQLPTEENPTYGTSYNSFYKVPDLYKGN